MTADSYSNYSNLAMMTAELDKGNGESANKEDMFSFIFYLLKVHLNPMLPTMASMKLDY